MVSRNSITGDLIKTKLNKSTDYEDNFDRIFRNKAKVAAIDTTTDKPVEHWSEDDEKRLDIIGQNGNIGYKEEK